MGKFCVPSRIKIDRFLRRQPGHLFTFAHPKEDNSSMLSLCPTEAITSNSTSHPRYVPKLRCTSPCVLRGNNDHVQSTGLPHMNTPHSPLHQRCYTQRRTAWGFQKVKNPLAHHRSWFNGTGNNLWGWVAVLPFFCHLCIHTAYNIELILNPLHRFFWKLHLHTCLERKSCQEQPCKAHPYISNQQEFQAHRHEFLE